MGVIAALEIPVVVITLDSGGNSAEFPPESGGNSAETVVVEEPEPKHSRKSEESVEADLSDSVQASGSGEVAAAPAPSPAKTVLAYGERYPNSKVTKYEIEFMRILAVRKASADVAVPAMSVVPLRAEGEGPA